MATVKELIKYRRDSDEGVVVLSELLGHAAVTPVLKSAATEVQIAAPRFSHQQYPSGQ
jgi:hypothetical protein